MFDSARIFCRDVKPIAFSRIRSIPWLVVLVVICATQLASGQSGPVVSNITAPPVPGAGHDYIGMLNETVNPGSGSVSLRIDIPTPEGRGLNFPFSVNYNSNQSLILEPSLNGGMQWISQTWTNAGGWSLSLPQLSYSVSSFTLDAQDQSNGDGTGGCHMITGPVFTDLDGISHPFNLNYIYDNVAVNALNPGVNAFLDTACAAAASNANFSMQGILGNTGAGSAPYTLSQTTGFDDPLYQAALTQIYADQTSVPSCAYQIGCAATPQGFPTPIVAGADGTVYVFPGIGDCNSSVQDCFAIPSTIEDRNGNILSVSAPSPGGYSVVDTGGRNVITVNGFVPNPTTTTITGSDGQPYTLTWSVVNFSGYTVGAVTLNPSGNCSNLTAFPTGSQSEYAVTKIAVPNGKYYTLHYDPTYGTLSQITYPNGGYISYSYAVEPDYGEIVAPVGQGTCAYEVERLMLTNRQVGFTDSSGNDQSPIESQAFYYANTLQNVATTIVSTTDNLRNLTYSTQYTYTNTGTGDVAAPLETSIIYTDGNGTALKTVTKSWRDQFSPLCEVETIGSASRGTIYGYAGAPFGGAGADILVDQKEYDYGQITSSACGATGAPMGYGVTPPSTTPAREIHTTLQAFGTTNYPIGQSLFDRPCKVVVNDSTGNPASETDVLYDGGASLCGAPGTPSTTAVNNLPPGTHDETLYGSSVNTSRGNITALTKKCFGCTDATTQYTYDETGEATSVADPNGNQTFIQHTDAPMGTYNTNAYVTNIDPPHVNNVSHTTSFSYNYATGEVATVMDENKQITSYSYNDPLNRLTLISYPDGGERGYCYSDVGGSYPTSNGSANCLNLNQFQVFSGTVENANQAITSYTSYDGLGRAVETGVTSAPEGTILTDTAYDGLGHVMTATNPYVSSPTGSVSYVYDALGRKISETEQDNSTLLWCYDGIQNSAWTNCPANQSSVSNATWVDSQDEAGHLAQHVSDGFGRLVAVIEQLPSGTTLGMETDYTYNGLDDLLAVNQKGVAGVDTARTRQFSYDSLSRLIQSYNPETGWECYGTTPGGFTNGVGTAPNGSNCTANYDPDSNLKSRINGNGVAISYNYDALNRMTSATASDSSIVNTYSYDGVGGGGGVGGIGRLTGSSSASSGGYYSYDSMGRMTQKQFATPLVPWSSNASVSAAFDLAGHLTSFTYPDGRQITQTIDSAGRLAKVSSPATSQSAAFDYIDGPASGNAIQYTPQGTEQAFALGSSIVQSNGYNSRLQLCQIQAGAVLPGNSSVTNFVNKQLFHAATPETLCGNAAGNNGNIWSIADAQISGLSQTFSYDNLDRLISAQSADGSYNQTYSIDSFGNMITGNTGMYQPNYLINSNNQLTLNVSDMQYDAAGNLAYTAGSLPSATIQSNALGQIMAINGTYALYSYDAEQNRTEKLSGSGTLDTVWFGGQPMAELSSTGVWTDYIYANGRKIARTDSQDLPIHISGDNCSDCGGTASYVQLTAGAGHVIQQGDTLYFTQYNVAPAWGGLILVFSDGSGTSGLVAQDQYGQQINCAGMSDQLYTRKVDLSSYAGKTLSSTLVIDDVCSPAGHFDLYFSDISIVGSNGAVTTIYGDEPAQTLTMVDSSSWPGPVSNMRAVSEPNVNLTPQQSTQQATRYFLADQVATAQMEFASGGWPIWKGEFTPYGQEVLNGAPISYVGGQPDDGSSMAYKFTGKERDQETGLDYFGARYYGALWGRFTAPDWAEKAEPVPYAKLDDPQTLNLYAYVRNNPVSEIDEDGHESPIAQAAAQGDTGKLCSKSEKTCADERGVTANNNQNNAQAQQNTAARATQAGEAVANTTLGWVKVKTAAKISPSSESGVGAAAAFYVGVSAAGNFAAGGIQAVGALTGKTEETEKMAEAAGTITSGPGLATFVATGDLNKAADAAALEGILTSNPKDLMSGGTLERAAKVNELRENIQQLGPIIKQTITNWIHPVSVQ